MEIEKTEFDAKINIESPNQMQLFLDEEERMLKDMVNSVTKSGANVIFCEKGIDDMALHFLGKAGVLALKRKQQRHGKNVKSNRRQNNCKRKRFDG